MSFADLLPPLSNEERQALHASIEAEGVRDPVLKDEDGNVLDGNHRLAFRPDAPVKVIPESGTWTQARKEAFVYQVNYARRNLSPEQKAEVDGKRREVARALYAETNGDGRTRKYSQEQVGALLGAPRRTVADWLAPDAGNGQGDTSGGSAKCIPSPRPKARNIKLDADDRKDIFDRWRAGETQKQVAADYGVSAIRVKQICAQEKARLAEDTRKQVTHTPDLPKKVYRCLVIDPPWPMKKSERTAAPDQGRKLAYATMKVERIEKLPVPGLADKAGCHVYLWVTHRFLPDGLRLFEAWGVSYHCLLTWVKPSGMTPYSWMFNTEHVLFGYRGKFKAGKPGLKVAFEAPVAGHSVKPDVFFDRVREFSAGPRLEMFARKPHDGFEGWGNEFSGKQ